MVVINTGPELQGSSSPVHSCGLDPGALRHNTLVVSFLASSAQLKVGDTTWNLEAVSQGNSRARDGESHLLGLGYWPGLCS